jgi:sterol desaturase/sphingolipid hydroxylase (fatty acid hydroxylase superfamily)
MRNIADFFKFKKLYLPVIFKVVFFITTLISLCSAVMVFNSNWHFSAFLLCVPLVIRVVVEWFIIPFKQYDMLNLISKSVTKQEASND